MSLKENVYFFCVFCIASHTMASPDVATFFPEINGNLTAVTWAHAVNNQSYLDSTLSNNDIMMIEADVILGTISGTNSTDQIPVMGHPPANSSDLSLATFLNTIDTFNTNSTNTAKKGVKIDFKSIEVFNQSLDVVRQYDQGSYPLWINADIISGPINASDPVNPNQFLEGAKQFNNTVLSLGWTTNFGSEVTGSYTDEQINSMLNTIDENGITQNITFPVRAGFAAESVSQMQTLLTNVTSSTLTLWSSEGDNVNVENLRILIAKIGIENAFVDVPEDLRDQLRLDDLPDSASVLVPHTIVMSLLIVVVAFLCK